MSKLLSDLTSIPCFFFFLDVYFPLKLKHLLAGLSIFKWVAFEGVWLWGFRLRRCVGLVNAFHMLISPDKAVFFLKIMLGSQEVRSMRVFVWGVLSGDASREYF